MDIELCRWGRLVIVMMFCTLSSWGQRLDVRSVGQLEARQYERGNGRGGCSRVSMGHVNVFCSWKCPREALNDAVAAAIRYVRYHRKHADESSSKQPPQLGTTNQWVRLPPPISQFDAPVEKHFFALGVSVHDMDVRTLSFQIKNAVSYFALRCVLVSFYHGGKFLFAVYVNVNTGEIAPDFQEVVQCLSLTGESRYPYLTVGECQKQDEACASLFRSVIHDVSAEKSGAILERMDRVSQEQPTFSSIKTNEVEVSVDGL